MSKHDVPCWSVSSSSLLGIGILHGSGDTATATDSGVLVLALLRSSDTLQSVMDHLDIISVACDERKAPRLRSVRRGSEEGNTDPFSLYRP